ncbi:MAG TPA: LamG-like jellyroll fold domain-containing protein, partial [Pyrinomonadaceae bacterium]|nr:LamG-like jellyroll fold domain-containing protein [Pyrinomonadaceae bacterium]
DTILDKRVNPSQPVGYALFLVNGRLGFQLADGSVANPVCGSNPALFACTNYGAPATSTNVASGDWHLVAVTVTKCPTPVGKMYVDGNLVQTFTPRTGSIDNNGALQIGRRDPAFSETHFDGCIDELEFFNRALTQSDIEAIFRARSSGKCKCPPITLNPAAGALPAGVVNIPYSQTFTATGGCSSSFTYSVTGGTLSPGLTLSANGVLSGTPKQPGVYTFTITATDKCGCTKSQTYTLTVDCPMVPLPLFNTGVADDGSLLASGATDAHYVLLNTSPVFPDAIVPQIPSAYLVNGPSSQWIGPDVNPLGNSPVGFYTYRVTFTMPAGADLSTAVIAGQWASDNEAQILLNGSPTGVTIGPTSFAAFTPFVITTGFMPGVNTLDFEVRNRGVGGGTTPTATGLRVEMSGSVRCCPITKADKCVITTSELHTMPANSNNGTPQLTIGEIIRYRLTATLAQGASPSFRFTDHLPPGLTYLGNPKVAFVSTGGAGTITSTAFSGLALNQNASSVGACSGPTPTFILPTSQVTGGPFSSGTDPTFNLGNLTNTHNDPNLEYVIVEFNALVNNLPVNALGLPNQNGATLSNFYDVFSGSPTSVPLATSTPTNVIIVEPHLDVQKTVTKTPGTSQAVFKVTMTNTGTATAFDVQMNDLVPAGLVVLSTPAPSVSVSPASCSQPAVTATGNALTLTAPTMPVGCTVTLTFTVDVSSSCPETNIAQVTYTSLPGGSNSSPVGTQPNNTGSVTPGPTGADNGDRVYTASAQASISGTGGAATPCQPSCGCPLKISRFRENGPNGTGDEFVEIFNPSDSDVLVSTCSEDPNGASNGIGVFASAGNGFNPHFGQAANIASLVCQIPGNTVIKGRGYYLCGGKDYSLGGLGNNGATSHSIPDQTIGAGNASSGTIDIPNDAGLALLNIGSNIVTQCVIGSLGCPCGFNFSDPGVGGTGNAAILDKVGFAPYGPGSPMNVGPGYPSNIYPSLASQYCEGTCLQPVGDASVITKGPGVPCPTTITPATGVSFPVLSGGTISGVRYCYGESGQYEILRRQTTWSSIVGTLHQDTNNNPQDFILLSPDPATGNVGVTITGVSGVTSVLGAAGAYNTTAPPDMLNFTQTFFSALTLNTTVPQPNPVNPENDPLGTVTFRLSYTNNSTKTITGLRFKVDNLSTLCGGQQLIPNSPLSIPASGNARNLLASPNCGIGANSAILKALNSLTATAIANGGPQTFHGTVLEDLSVGPPSPGALSPFAGGVDSSFVLIDDAASNPLGDGVTGGKGKF